MNWIREWCETNKLDYDIWMSIIETVYDLILTWMQLGIKIPIDDIEPLSKILKNNKNEGMEEVKKIKQCLYEGFRLNSLSWNSRMNCYITTNKHNAVNEPNIGKTLITNNINYRNNSFTLGDYKSVLDGFVILDNHFMY